MTIYEAAGQIYIFLSCVFLGAALGILWQLTHFKPAHRIAVAAGDIVFCALAVAAVFFGLLRICYGSMRFYCFLGILIGFFLWLKTLGWALDNLSAAIYNFITKLSGKFKRKNDGKQNNEEN